MHKLKKVLLTFLVVILTITTAFIFNEPVKADEDKDDKDLGYCFLCNQDSNGEYYKEVQFINKIKTIKSIFGNSIDEIVLAATVLHKYSAAEVINEQYDENWKQEDYRTSWTNFKSNISSLEDAQGKIDAKNEQIDLLTAATIVMLNSNPNKTLTNPFGTYDEEKYKKALAGNQLVGDDTPFGHIFNGAFCTVGAAVDFASTPLQYVHGVFSGDTVQSINTRRETRYKNMLNICTNGYIGGVYEGVKDIENEEQKQASKDNYAQQIIDLANYYKRLRGDVGDSCVVTSSTGDFAGWKQYDDAWGDISVGGGGSIRSVGCLVTSLSILIAHAGTQITNLPSGFDSFNPGAFVTNLNSNGGFDGSGGFLWHGFANMVPNLVVGDSVPVNSGDLSHVSGLLEKELSSPTEGNYQKYLLLQIHHNGSSQHWVAVDNVSNGSFTIFDPGASGTTLDENYSGWVVEKYTVVYMKDVQFGQTGNSTSSLSGSANYCGGGTGQCDEDKMIPESANVGAGLYTVEGSPQSLCSYVGWGPGEICKKYWSTGKIHFERGMAMYDGRYLIAAVDTFGKNGDYIDFHLDNGDVIKTVMFDSKRRKGSGGQEDANSGVWGHMYGGQTNVLEFIVAPEYVSKANPSNWIDEWKGTKVVCAENIGNNIIADFYK